jgi:PIN domain nuclease of toxin-antitoxin system
MLSCPERLNDKRRYELESSANEVYLSSMSIAELMIKESIGKIKIEFAPLEIAKTMEVEILDLSGSAALLLGQLPFYHKDPFDRILIAQTIEQGIYLMSDDTNFRHYPCKII